MQTSLTQLGNQAEKFVGQYLKKHGFNILEYNYKKKFGEVDIIAQKGTLIVFVEVKMRTNAHFDSATLITNSKQRRIINVAYEYIGHFKHDDKDCRFDVALVGIENNEYEITYLINAFGDQ